MRFSFLNGGRSREQIFAVDLGTRTTKAVLLERQGDAYSLARFTVQDAPIYDKVLPQGLLTEHLRSIMDAMQPKTRQVILSIGAGDSILRSTELPLMPVSEMRQMLKFNSKPFSSWFCAITSLIVSSFPPPAKSRRKRPRRALSNTRCGLAAPAASC
jgi:Tfp pilus assembly PilM family ATPase